MKEGNIKNFTDLVAWKKSFDAVLKIYGLTRKFPDEEIFGITSQIRRSASSVTANIAEGYGRYYYKDKIRFYYQARGSNTETQNHLILAYGLKYVSSADYDSLILQLQESHRLINGLIKGAENFTN